MSQLEKLLRSGIHRKILDFFRENPQSVDTPRGISTWTREEIPEVRRALEDWVRAKVLIANRGATTTGYSYTQDRVVIERVEEGLRKTGKGLPAARP